jgi:hypothetical protein
MLRMVLLLAVVILAPAFADVPLVPPIQPGPQSLTPAYHPDLPLFLSVPWDTNALADSLDTSPPPDGALFVARAAGPDSSVVILTYNFLYNSAWSCRISRSTNSGKTYTPQTVATGYWVDDVIHGNGRDTVYHVSIANVGGSYHLFLRRSFDAGDSWSDTIRVDRGTSTFTDKPMLTSQDSCLYCTYSDFSGGTNYVRMCRSTDFGVTWNAGDINVSTDGGQGSCPAGARNGEVYVIWGQPAAWVPTSLWFNRSTDYGLTWDVPLKVDDVDTAPHMYRWRANHSFPAMAVDSAGKIYVTVQNRLHGQGWDVAVYTSVDTGATWQGPYQVNDDTVTDSDQYCSWIAVDRHQRPHVFWYDNRNYCPDSTGDVYYSWSEDGGQTWQPNEQVNDVSPCWGYQSASMMGDFQQIRCDTNYVYCEWSDHRNGRHSWSYIAAARRPLPPLTGVAERPVTGAWQQSRFALEQNRPNPVVYGTTISYELERPQAVKLVVYDLAGNLVRTLQVGNKPTGPRQIFWDRTDDMGRRVVAGVYFCRLQVGDASASRKLAVR